MRPASLLPLAVLLLAGCAVPDARPANAGGNDFPVTQRDALGNRVTVRAEPQRIVSLAPAMTEILFALGLGNRIVGVTAYCDYPAAAKAKPKIGGIVNPSVERILAQAPELALGTRLNPRPVLRTLARAGIPTYAADARDFDQVMACIRAVGALTGRRPQAAQLVAAARARLLAVRKQVAGLAEPTVIMIYQQDPLWVAGADTFADHLLRLAGARNAARGIQGYKQYSVEMLLAQDPEVILLSSMAGGEEADQVRAFVERPSMRGLSAVRHRRVYVINADTVARAGPRIVEGIEVIAARLHPEAFKHR
ncbi:MAG TPA: helical backbone metal receptor [Armatimonadota bacterium]|nr:helical backbone metal receptor [Armatimonadota bacterium]